MIIQHNIQAMNSYRNLSNNQGAIAGNLEKLSSGYQINRAGDNAAGLAISEKMRSQITGLGAAQANVADGISLVKTAEGALQETHDMLNRMTELATQSANGTYDNEVDRAALQAEVDELLTEIDRIADSTNFNGINLLDGSMDESAPVTFEAGITSSSSSVSTNEITAGTYNKTTYTDKDLSSLLDGKQDIYGGELDVVIGYTNADGSTGEIDLSSVSTSGLLTGKIEYGHEQATASITAQVKDYSEALRKEISTDASIVAALGKGDITQGDIDTYIATIEADALNKALNNEEIKKLDGDTVTVGGIETSADINTTGATYQLVADQYDSYYGDARDDYDASTVDPAVDLDTTTATPADIAKYEDQAANRDEILAQINAMFEADGADVRASFVRDDATKEYQLVITGTKEGAYGGHAIDAADSSSVNTGDKIYTSETKSTEKADSMEVTLSAGIKDGDKITINGVSFEFTNDAQLEGTTGNENQQYISLFVQEDVKNGKTSVGIAKNTTELAESLTKALNSAVSAAKASGDTTNGLYNMGLATFDGNTVTLESVYGKQADGDALTLQIGDTSDDFNKLEVNVKDMHAEALGINKVDISTQDGASAAIDVIKSAINAVSTTRAGLGAAQNRLEHTANNLSVAEENIQDAEATIRDTDVAAEMMEYTKNNILIQSAQSMLAQANQLPQGVLQLLG